MDLVARVITISLQQERESPQIFINSTLFEALSELKNTAEREYEFISNKTQKHIGKFQTAWFQMGSRWRG